MPHCPDFYPVTACLRMGFLSLWRTPGIRLLWIAIAVGGPLMGFFASPVAERGLFFWSLASAACYFFLVAVLVLYILTRPFRPPVAGVPLDPLAYWFVRACGAWLALLIYLTGLVGTQVLSASISGQLVGYDPRTAAELSLIPSYATLLGSLCCLATSLLPWSLTLSVVLSPTVASTAFLLLVLGGSLLRGIAPDLGLVRFLFGIFPDVSLLLPERPFADASLSLWGYAFLHGVMILVLGALFLERRRESGKLGVAVGDEDSR